MTFVLADSGNPYSKAAALAGAWNTPPSLCLEAQRIGDGPGDQRFRQSMGFAASRNATTGAN
ncbi:MAG: hypothetical protein ACYDEY_14245 [Acidimicrobiales bacterium]